MRLTKFLYLLCIFFAVQPALAQSSYKLQPGDVIEIWVAQYTDLNREITLAPDGWVSLPLAGALNAQGMTIEALQTTLIDRLQPFFTDEIGLNVSLVPSEQHQPSIFVVGDVEAPGLYPFRPGMTVLHAVSVAGGLYRPALAAADRDRSLEVQSLMASSRKRLTELDIMIARINAQIAGRSDFDIPADIDVAEATGFAEREQALLTMQNNNIKSQQDSLARTTTINEESIAATNDQIDSIKRRIELAQERLTATSTLVDRGVMQASQIREIEVNIVDMETSVSQLRTTLATQQATILTEQGRVSVLVQEYQVGLVTQLGALEQERETVAAELVNYQQTQSLYEPETEQTSLLTYEIIRPNDGGEIDVDATERTSILPGDLVRVTRSSVAADVPAPEQAAQPVIAPDSAPVATDETS